jgi:citrate lyase subunit beta/citryl-CoA lyase
MTDTDLGLCRSLLFLPASNPRAIAKARELPADLVILDLEDAVAEQDKEAARGAAIEASRAGFGGRPAAIRINAVGSPHYAPDMLAARQSGAQYVILPKAESLRDVEETKAGCGRALAIMIETPRGVLEAAGLAGASAALIAGTNDLGASLRIPHGAGRVGLGASLQHIVLAGRAAGIPVFDGVYNRLDDPAGLQAEAEEGRSFGFDGKSVIHPGQIETVNRVFAPSPDELAAAEALIAAAAGGAQRHNGQMIEDLHVAQARLLIARAPR